MDEFEDPNIIWEIALLLHRAKLCLLRVRPEPTYREPCVDPECIFYHRMLQHVMYCSDDYCDHPDCVEIRTFISHYNACIDGICQLCSPVRGSLDRPFWEDWERSTIVRMDSDMLGPSTPRYSRQIFGRVDSTSTKASSTPSSIFDSDESS